MKIYNDNEYQFALGVVEMLWDTPSNVFGTYIDAIEEYEESLVNPDACITMPASLYHKLSFEEYEESLLNKDACIKMPLSLYHKLSR